MITVQTYSTEGSVLTLLSDMTFGHPDHHMCAAEFGSEEHALREIDEHLWWMLNETAEGEIPMEDHIRVVSH